jgi:hydroxyacylglutathione hydrolase
MPQAIQTIALSFSFGGVNCYLVKTAGGYILIDTGIANKRADLEKELVTAGCKPGDLKLIIITHADSDHIGSCAYLRQKYGAKIAMHPAELGVSERGDMGSNRKRIRGLQKALLSLFKLGEPDRFTPDIRLEEGYDFTPYGFNARVLHIPGHSIGSIGILTGEGDLFCGDLLVYRRGRAGKTTLVDDPAELDASVERLKGLGIRTVYPGHGVSFPMSAV